MAVLVKEEETETEIQATCLVSKLELFKQTSDVTRTSLRSRIWIGALKWRAGEGGPGEGGGDGDGDGDGDPGYMLC
jgi:hypothetical protein